MICREFWHAIRLENKKFRSLVDWFPRKVVLCKLTVARIYGTSRPVPVLAFLSFGPSNGQSNLSSSWTERRIRIWCWPTTSSARIPTHLRTCASLYGNNPAELSATETSFGDYHWVEQFIKQDKLKSIYLKLIKFILSECINLLQIITLLNLQFKIIIHKEKFI